MSRRGGGRQSQPPRTQPSPMPTQPTGRGRGRGRGARGGATIPASSEPHSSRPSPSPAPSPAPQSSASHSAASSVAASSSSAPPPSVPLPLDVEQKLTLQSSVPTSTKAIRFPDRPTFGQLGRKIQVRANHFQLQVTDRDYYLYDVSISPEITSKKISREVISKLVGMYQESMLGNRIPAYDGRKILYTAGPLPFTSKEFVIKLGDEEDEAQTSSTRKKRDREFKVTIRFASKTDMHNLNQFLHRLQLDCPQETIQALDVALRATPSEHYTVVGRSFFSPSLGNTGPLGSGTEYWRGYYQSLRPTQMGLSLNIDVSARAFYEPVLVTDFISKHFHLNFSRPLSDQDRVKVRKALRGLRVRVSHGKNIRSYKVAGISKEPLKELMFTLEDQVTKKSVIQYFRERYGKEVKYSVLPAIQAGSDTKPVYLPMELCMIESGQRYSKRLNEEQVTNLLRASCQRPQERQNFINQIVKQHNFNTDPFVREFGIRVREDLALIDARVLPPPTLKYHETGREARVEPRMGQWNMIDKKMVKAGNIKFWGCICFSTRINRDVPFQFCTELVNMCTSKGMIFHREPLIPITAGRPHQLARDLVDFDKQCKAKVASLKQQGGLQLLIIILPDVKGSYGQIKRICETELGIVSQCCQPRQVAKMNKQYLENLSLKINVKVAGCNTYLNDAFEKRIPRLSDMPTIIFGADVTHPQPGEDSSPSIAAVVASMDWPWVTTYRALVSAQLHREEIIQDLYNTNVHPEKGITHGGMIRELILAFYKTTGMKPKRIIFYRDGVSEGQFSQVLLYEMDAIRKACASFEEGYLPPVTFVVVQKRHHTRLFPVDHRSRDQTDKSGNIMPGTVVDTSICHPREFDFYLNSHAGIQGTSRPTHYHVLYDENRFSADGLQSLTNNLCYTYARCTRSVSIVPPAYYAHLAAFRARYYIEDQLENDSGSRSANQETGSKNKGTKCEVKLPSIKQNVKEVMFYC